MPLRYLLVVLPLVCGPSAAALGVKPAATPTVRLVVPAARSVAAPAARFVTAGAARPAAIRPTFKEAPAGPMVFYVVKGAVDSCGRGCDSWIAAEGQIDAAAAPRFRKFWTKVRDRNL